MAESPRSERKHHEAGQVGKQPQDDSSQHDHAATMPRIADGPATESVHLGSNIRGAQRRAQPRDMGVPPLR